MTIGFMPTACHALQGGAVQDRTAAAGVHTLRSITMHRHHRPGPGDPRTKSVQRMNGHAMITRSRMKRLPKHKPPAIGLPLAGFDLETYLGAAGPASRVLRYAKAETIFSQGDAAQVVKYI